jgi:hypothetical protein
MHIWTAADSRGLLQLGAFGCRYGVVNFVTATAVFLYVSGRVAGAVEDLTPWVLGEREKEGERDDIPLLQFRAILVEDRSQVSPEETRAGSWSTGDFRVRVLAIVAVLWILNVVSFLRHGSVEWTKLTTGTW